MLLQDCHLLSLVGKAPVYSVGGLGSISGCTNTQGLKIIFEMVLSLYTLTSANGQTFVSFWIRTLDCSFSRSIFYRGTQKKPHACQKEQGSDPGILVML